MATIEELEKQIQDNLALMEENDKKLEEQKKKYKELDDDLAKNENVIKYNQEQEKKCNTQIDCYTSRLQELAEREKTLKENFQKDVPVIRRDLDGELLVGGSIQNLHTLSDYKELKGAERSEECKRYNSLLKLHRFLEERDKIINPNSATGSDTINTEYFQDIEDLIKVENTLEVKKNELHLNDGDDIFHNMRGTIKQLISENPELEYDSKHTFTSLKQDAIHNPTLYKKTFEKIKETIYNAKFQKYSEETLIKYLDDYNEYALENAKVERTKALLNSLQNRENIKAKELKKLVEKQEIKNKAITDPAAYLASLDEKGNKLRQEFDHKAKMIKAKYASALMKKTACASAFSAIKKISTIVTQTGATLHLADLKSNLAELKKQIEDTNEAIKDKDALITDVNRAMARDKKEVASVKAVRDVVNGVLATNNDQLNLKYQDIAKKQLDLQKYEEELENLKQKSNSLKKDYDKKVKNFKETHAVEHKMAEFFGIGFVESTDKIKQQIDKAEEKKKVTEADQIQIDTENQVDVVANAQKQNQSLDFTVSFIRQNMQNVKDSERMLRESETIILGKHNEELRNNLDNWSDKASKIFTDENKELINTAVAVTKQLVSFINTIRGNGGSSDDNESHNEKEESEKEEGISDLASSVQEKVAALKSVYDDRQTDYVQQGLDALKEAHDTLKKVRDKLEAEAIKAENEFDEIKYRKEALESDENVMNNLMPVVIENKGRVFLIAKYQMDLNDVELQKTFIEAEKEEDLKIQEGIVSQINKQSEEQTNIKNEREKVGKELENTNNNKTKLTDKLKELNAQLEVAKQEKAYQEAKEKLDEASKIFDDAIQKHKETTEKLKVATENEIEAAHKLKEMPEKQEAALKKQKEAMEHLKNNEKAFKTLETTMKDQAKFHMDRLEYCIQNKYLNKAALCNKLQAEINKPNPDNVHIQALSALIARGPEAAQNDLNKDMVDFFASVEQSRQELEQKRIEWTNKQKSAEDEMASLEQEKTEWTNKQKSAASEKVQLEQEKIKTTSERTEAEKKKISFAELLSSENSKLNDLRKKIKPLEQTKQKQAPSKGTMGK